LGSHRPSCMTARQPAQRQTLQQANGQPSCNASHGDRVELSALLQEYDVLPVPETGHPPARFAADSRKPDHQIIATGE
jgi:hypothetical protein